MGTTLLSKTAKGTYTATTVANTAYKVVLKGAGGGCADANPGPGGNGHAMTGFLVTTSATALTVNVGEGGQGGAAKSSSVTSFNGGGAGGRYGGGGGGATDIRIGGTDLANRIFIAGGGGGSADATEDTTAGHGGYPNGGKGTKGTGGTQTAGGTGYKSGALGVGANAYFDSGSSYDAGGGGGGYYGGGSGKADGESGGGGSSYFNSTYIKYPSYSATGGGSKGGQTKDTKGTDGTVSIVSVATPPTISVTAKNATSVTLTYNFNNEDASTSYKKTITGKIGSGTASTLVSVTSAGTSNATVSMTIPANTDATLTFVINNGFFSKTITYKYDSKAPVVSFPSETYNKQHYEGETVTLFTATDTNDTSIDYDYKVYVNNQLYTQQSNVKGNTLKLPYFDNMPESYKFKVEVRAKQSSDTSNGTNTDIWSSWYTSNEITVYSSVRFNPSFPQIKWYQDVEQQALISPFTEFETQHYCNGELHTTSQHVLGLTPPLLYTPVKPHLWAYEYYTMTRAKVEGVWGGWYKSPVVEVQFNVQPNDITFSKEIPKYFIEGEIVTVEWDESTDPNSTKTTYTVSLMNNGTEELFEIRGVEEPRLTFTVPKGVISNQVTLGIVAYSDGLYSNPVSSPNLAITDVKVMDCTLDFPRLTTNVLGEFKKLTLEINNDRRVEFEDNLDNYLLPLHYFRKGENMLTLIATDRNDVEITRSWKVTLDFNLQDLEQVNTLDLKGYVSFNHNESEQYVPCTTLFKPNLDLGIVEHELYGSTTFEGADSITQKLVITRDVNDDISQLRTLKITGAIE